MLDRYWTVRLEVYAFDSQEQADEYHQRLLDAFMAMPESAGYAATSTVIEKDEDDAA